MNKYSSTNTNTNASIAQTLANEAMEKMEEKMRVKSKHEKSKAGVVERANRAIALRNTEKNAHRLITLCEKEKSCNEDSIGKNILLEKISSLVNTMKSDMENVLR